MSLILLALSQRMSGRETQILQSVTSFVTQSYYQRAKECEAKGISVTIRLPTGEEVTAEKFREMYLLKDAD
jgi:hypothetical protein